MVTKSHPPVSVIVVILALAIFVPLEFYTKMGVRNWLLANSPAAALTSRFFWAVGLGRCVGAISIAIALYFHRQATTIVCAILALWLGGPAISFLMMGIDALAGSAGQTSWPLDGTISVLEACAFPAIATLMLVAPSNVRSVYGLQSASPIGFTRGI